jgi:Transposase DDE domain group 1
MIAQGVLGFQYEVEQRSSGLTAFAGLPLYLELAQVAQLFEALDRHLSLCTSGQGWSDRQIVTALILLNLVGGECVEDLDRLEQDEGFGRILRRLELHGLKRRERREQERRWRRERKRSVPSPSSVFRYLKRFEGATPYRSVNGRAVIPELTRPLQGLVAVNRSFLGFVQKHSPQEVATLDIDATLTETAKKEAQFCYKHFRAYQPLNVWWAEQGLVAFTEFRDGNVPAGYEQLRVLKEALAVLPAGVKKVYMRSDSAGYQHELMSYCVDKEREAELFGKIDFAISVDVGAQFRQAVCEVAEDGWHRLYRQVGKALVETDQEWAEVCFVPNAIGHSLNGPSYRYLAIREPLRQRELPGLEEEQQPLPDVVDQQGQRYKIFGVVTTLDWAGESVIWWHRGRCGKSEEAHAVMKEDLAGGKLPSRSFEANAAWWWIMVLSLNLNAALKRLVLGGEWVNKRMKAVRLNLIFLPARVLEHARQLQVRLSGASRAIMEQLLAARSRILELARAAPG